MPFDVLDSTRNITFVGLQARKATTEETGQCARWTEAWIIEKITDAQHLGIWQWIRAH